jgi:hypothetical protein
MTTTPLPTSPVTSPVELTARWSGLLDPPVFAARSLWLAWMAPDGLMLPMVLPVDDLPDLPEPRMLAGLRTLHEAVAGTSGPLHLALALCRPGAPAVDADDVVWSEALRAGLGERVDGTWSLHLAAGGEVTPVVDPPAWAWR